MSDAKLFLALSVGPKLRTDLEQVMRKLRTNADQGRIEVRWVPPEMYHMTLVFLGRMKPLETESVIRSLSSEPLYFSPRSISVKNIGTFPQVMAARVIWAGVARTQELFDLQTQVEGLLGIRKTEEVEREFFPHITLGRLRNARSVKDMISPFVRRQFTDLEVSQLTLFESVQHGPNVDYRAVQHFPLVPPPVVDSDLASQ